MKLGIWVVCPHADFQHIFRRYQSGRKYDLSIQLCHGTDAFVQQPKGLHRLDRRDKCQAKLGSRRRRADHIELVGAYGRSSELGNGSPMVFSHNPFAAEEAQFCKSTSSSKALSIAAIDMPPSLGSRLTIQKCNISTLYYTNFEKVLRSIRTYLSSS